MTTPPSTPDRSYFDSFDGFRHLYGRLYGGWQQFWFTPADPATLGLIRLGAGIVTFYVILVYTWDMPQLLGKDAWVSQETINKLRWYAPVALPPTGWFVNDPPSEPPMYSEEWKYVTDYRKEWGGTDPRLIFAQGNPVWSVWYHVTEPRWMMVAHVAILAIIFLFAIGCCTRVTSVLTYLGVVSYIQRAPTTLFGMDTMMIICLIYLAIGPSGAALSVDRLIGRWWARRQARKAGKPLPPDGPSPPLVSANFAIRLMQIHFCIIYLAAGLSKLQGSAWWNGTAVWGTMANPSFNPLHIPLYLQFLVFLSEHRWLWEIVINGGTVFTVLTEICVPFLIWNPRLRWIMIVQAVMLHVGIALMMGLVGFGLFMLCLLLSFVPSDVSRRLIDDLDDGVRRKLASFGFPSASGSVSGERAAKAA